MKDYIKCISLSLATVMAIAVISGCTKKEESSADGVVLRYWCGVDIGDGTTDIKDLPFVKALREKSGVEFEYIVPSVNADQRREQFNLMIASNNLPDIIETNWGGYVGGPSMAIKDKVLIPLNEIIEDSSPAFKQLMETMPELDEVLRTPEGDIYCYPFLRVDERQRVFNGPFMRKDWLDELGLDVPETIDEWENMLIQFRDKKGAKAPLAILPNFIGGTAAIMGAYGVRNNFYFADDRKTIVYGPIEEGYRQYLTLMNKWYNEKLFDNNFAQIDGTILNANMTNGTTGATFYAAGGGIGRFLDLMKDEDPNYDLVAAKYPVLRKGETSKFGAMEPMFNQLGAGITTACKDVEQAVKLLDFGYSEEGSYLYNFGIEGVSYTMIDDFPTYTEFVTDNPNGEPANRVLPLYTRNSAAPFAQDFRTSQNLKPEQLHALELWRLTNEAKFRLPSYGMTDDENKEYTKIMTDINTLVEEKFVMFISGTESLDKFDDYVKQVKDMNIDRALEILREAILRYSQR